MLQLQSKKLLLLFCFWGLLKVSSFSQNIGDFQSNAVAGNWSAIGSWQQCFVAGAWAAATSTPTSANGVITIRAGHTITVDVSVTVDQVIVNNTGIISIATTKVLTINNGTLTDLQIDAGGTVKCLAATSTLTILASADVLNNGTLAQTIGTAIINNNGIITNSGTITSTNAVNLKFLAGSFYKHSFLSSVAIPGIIPASTWNGTSTCEILACGNTGFGPTGLNQILGHFTWNNTTQPLDINLNGLLTTVIGNFTMTSSNGFNVILKTNTGGPTTVSGNFSMTSGSIVIAKIVAPINTINQLSISGTYTQSGGTMIISNGSGTLASNTGNGFLTVGGISSITGGFVNLCTSTWVGAGGNGDFTATGLITLSGTGVINGCSSSAIGSGGVAGTITANGGITINAGGTLNLNTSTTTGSGGSSFLNANGLVTLSGGIINGSTSATAGTTGCNSTINAFAGLTISSGTLNLTPGSITGGGGNGTIDVSGALTVSGGTLNINSSTATAGTVGSNGSVAVSTTCTISGAGTIVNVTSSSTTGGGGDGTLSVTGAFSMTTGTFNLCSTSGAGTGDGLLDIDGACTFSGGTFSITSTSTTAIGVGNGTLNVGGNFSHVTAAAAFTKTGSATAVGTININGITAAQTIESTSGFTGTPIVFNITEGGVALAKCSINALKTFTVNSGTTLNLNDNSVNAGYDLQVVATGTLKVSGIMNVNSLATLDLLGYTIIDAATGAGFFNLNSDATLITKHAQGITTLASGATGCIQVTGGRSYSSGASYTYNSSTASQVTGNGLPTILTSSSTLTINNSFAPLVSNGVTLTQATTTAGTLTLTAGRFITSAALFTIDAGGISSSSGSISAFVDGPIKKIGNTSFIFPTGDVYTATGPALTAKWARIEIGAPTNLTDAFTAEYHKINDPCNISQVVSPTNGAGINHVSYKEYWDLTRTSAAAVTPTVKLYWETGASGTTLGSAISSIIPADLNVAECIAGTWTDENSAIVATTGAAAGPGTITTNLGTTTFTTNTIMPFTFSTPSGVSPLPIELLTFTGYSTNNGNQLNWSTATETNNNYFELERGSDAATFFEFALINGAGNSTSVKNYDYLDLSPLSGINYYRLKQIDFNGNYTYSNVIAIDKNAIENATVTVFPNPSNDVVNIITSSNIASVNIYDMLGNLVYSNPEQQQNKIEFKPLSDGIYIVKAISFDGKITSTRFVKN